MMMAIDITQPIQKIHIVDDGHVRSEERRVGKECPV